MSLRPGLVTEPILLQVPDAAGMLHWAEVFGNGNPVELEIGSGKGTFLLRSAQTWRDRNFIGIEWAKAYAEFAADRLRRHNCLNARMVHAEALWWLRCHVPDNSLDVLHVYFPDPWPKSRHHKRRLIQPFFLQHAHRMLRPGGQIKIVTDHAGYFQHIEDVFQAQTLLTLTPFVSPLVGAEPMEDVGAEQPLLVGSNFERKYIRENRPFYSIAAQKPM